MHTHKHTGVQGYCRFVSAQYWLLHSKRPMNFSRLWISHVFFCSFFLSKRVQHYCFVSYENLNDSLVRFISAPPANKCVILQWETALWLALSEAITSLNMSHLDEAFVSSLSLVLLLFSSYFLLSNCEFHLIYIKYKTRQKHMLEISAETARIHPGICWQWQFDRNL